MESSSRMEYGRSFLIHNILEFISVLLEEIKEKIFNKVIDYHEYPDSSDDPFPKIDQINELAYRVSTIFHHVIDEDANWGYYVICEASPLSYDVF